MGELEAKILVVDDDAAMTSAVCEVLRQAGYSAHGVQSGRAALEIVKRETPDLLITDLRMTEMSGHQLQQELQTIAPDLPVLIITGFGTVESAVESMKLGARDFVTKPFSNKELLLVVSRTLENRRLRQEVKQLRAELARSYGLPNIIAADPKMAAVLEMVERVADSPATVLINGESGTGKDCWLGHSTFPARGATGHSYLSIAPLFPRISSKASCSVTHEVPLPMPVSPRTDCL